MEVEVLIGDSSLWSHAADLHIDPMGDEILVVIEVGQEARIPALELAGFRLVDWVTARAT